MRTSRLQACRRSRSPMCVPPPTPQQPSPRGCPHVPPPQPPARERPTERVARPREFQPSRPSPPGCRRRRRQPTSRLLPWQLLNVLSRRRSQRPRRLHPRPLLHLPATRPFGGRRQRPSLPGPGDQRKICFSPAAFGPSSQAWRARRATGLLAHARQVAAIPWLANRLTVTSNHLAS